jgi:hypothetical protein
MVSPAMDSTEEPLFCNVCEAFRGSSRVKKETYAGLIASLSQSK